MTATAGHKVDERCAWPHESAEGRGAIRAPVDGADGNRTKEDRKAMDGMGAERQSIQQHFGCPRFTFAVVRPIISLTRQTKHNKSKKSTAMASILRCASRFSSVLNQWMFQGSPIIARQADMPFGRGLQNDGCGHPPARAGLKHENRTA